MPVSVTSRRPARLLAASVPPLLFVSLVVSLAAVPATAFAHSPFAIGEVALPTSISAALLALAWLLHPVGCHRQRHRNGAGKIIGFHCTMALLALTLFGPLDDWAEHSAAAHMSQHMLLMLVIAPLGVLVNPLPVWRAALGARSDWLWRALLAVARRPMAATLLHALAIWGWHAPAAYLLALRDPLWHVIEHACFLLSAWWFWWPVLRGPRSRAGDQMLALTTTMVHTGLLGALLTFSGRILYADGDARTLMDQQLAGLIMWVPGSLLYLAALGWCLRRWLRQPAGLRTLPR